MSALRTAAPTTAGSLQRRLRARTLTLVALAASTLMLCACASTRAPTDSDLTGQWQLDGAASDNVEARVAQAVDRAEARQRQRVSRMGLATGRGRGEGGADDMGQSGAEPVVAMPFIGPDFRQLRQRLLQVLSAPPTLRLDVQEETVTIQSDHLPPRDYQPGEPFVRFDEYGSATVSSKWSARAFVVRERYTSHAELSERYEVDPKSGALTYTRELKDPTVGRIELKSIYHHA